MPGTSKPPRDRVGPRTSHCALLLWSPNSRLRCAAGQAVYLASRAHQTSFSGGIPCYGLGQVCVGAAAVMSNSSERVSWLSGSMRVSAPVPSRGGEPQGCWHSHYGRTRGSSLLSCSFPLDQLPLHPALRNEPSVSWCSALWIAHMPAPLP